MSILAVSGNLPAGKEVNIKQKREIASLQEICLNIIDREGDLASILQKYPHFRKLRSSAINLILYGFEPYAKLPQAWKERSAKREFNRMDLPLSHTNESRIFNSMRHRFQNFKEDVLETFSDQENQIPVDQIKDLEDPKLFLQAIIQLAKTHPVLTTWKYDSKPMKDVLLEFADTFNLWEAINALLAAGAKRIPLEEDSED